MSILVCGGAGYIGSHTVHQLINQNKDVIIIDNLQTGHMDAVNKKAKFYKMKLRWWRYFFWRTATIVDWIDFMLAERVGLANTG